MATLTDPRPNAPEWSVSELSAALKRTVEEAYGHVRVRGEISGYRGPHSSGHAYFSLKDQGARLDAVIWKGNFARLKVRPEEGLEVVAIGRLTTYPGKSGYQIVIETLEFAGAGAIMAMLEERKRKLQAEGLFDPARKRPLPFLPRVVGVVTSPTGAVIRDILHRLSDRFPRHVLVWPVRVQGETSAAEVAAAIRGFNALETGGPIPRPDVIVVARGGGSLEDLLGFSEEIVVRAAAESAIPLVSAVGHETDVTLIDFAADMRAPTPTAAAEMVVPVRADLVADVEGFSARLNAAPLRLLDRRRSELRSLARLLPTAENLLAAPRQRLDMASDRLPRALKANALAHRLQLDRAKARLSPTALALKVERAREKADRASGSLAVALRRNLQKHREQHVVLTRRLETARAAYLRERRAALVRSREKVEALDARARRAVAALLRQQGRALASATQMLGALSYHGVLERGFALIRDEAGQAVRNAAKVVPGQRLDIEFADGRLAAEALSGPDLPAPGPKRQDRAASPATPKTTPRKKAEARKAPPKEGQPTLFDP